MENRVYNHFNTPVGDVAVAHLAHGSLHIVWNNKNIYLDPYVDVFDYTGMPKADLVFITHAHTDHYCCAALEKIVTPNTEFIVSKGVKTCLDNKLSQMGLNVDCNELNVDPSTNLENMLSDYSYAQGCKITTLCNGEGCSYNGVGVCATAAYNIHQRRDNGNPFHLKGEGNGYILDFGGFKIYIAGDTELTPELLEISGVDVAFLPKNLPYTLSDEAFLHAANTIKPKYLFPIHYFEVDPLALRKQLNPFITLFVNGVIY
ncbi:MAG: MBL fold metallo-hydrolase [Bacteroidales bacterium]|nr:MBL fold metallo-hydrolase [Bacteroidales bacterium]